MEYKDKVKIIENEDELLIVNVKDWIYQYSVLMKVPLDDSDYPEHELRKFANQVVDLINRDIEENTVKKAKVRVEKRCIFKIPRMEELKELIDHCYYEMEYGNLTKRKVKVFADRSFGNNIAKVFCTMFDIPFKDRTDTDEDSYWHEFVHEILVQCNKDIYWVFLQEGIIKQYPEAKFEFCNSSSGDVVLQMSVPENHWKK